MPTTQFIKNPFTSRFCEQMNVPGTHDRQVASYLIGTPNPSSITNPGFMAVCFNCAKSIVEKLPDELLVFVDAEKALALMSEEKRDAVLDKFYEDSDPKEALESLLETMDKEAVKAILLERGYLSDEGQSEEQQIEQQRREQQQMAEAQMQQPLKCPHCDYETANPAALRGHIGGKHKAVKQG